MMIEGPVQGQSAILRYLLNRPAETPADVHEKLEQLSLPETAPSPVVACIEAAELIYARKDDLASELLTLGADLAEMAARNDFHGFGRNGRGLGINRELRKIEGVAPAARAGTSKPPEPKAEYAAAVEPAEASAD